MDAGAFGLSRNPFQRSPELDEACLPNTIAALLSELQAGLRSPQGVSVLVGEAGSGKTMAASAFARRLGSVAQTAVLLHPTSSVGAIARDALAQLGGADADAVQDDNWVEALMVGAHRRARSGKSTVLLLDDAHRLSPQTLEDLAELFDDDAPASLHLFLFGRPRLLDRMHAGPEKALHAHLLQVGRLEPLGLRECVRYLERRVALCGGELAAMFDEGAIDELIRISEGRLVLLEQNALAALERATKRRVPRAQPEDVRPVARVAADEEEEVMAVKQQPLRFELPDESDEEEAEWEAGDSLEDEEADEWGHDAEADEEEWHADDQAEDESFDDPSLSWENAAPSFDDRNEEADDDDAFARPAVPPLVGGRKRLMGRAVLSVAACLGLVWAANSLPGPDSDPDHGRDSKLFAERLSSRPEEILRLARSTEAADADAQVKAWLAEPRPVRSAEPVVAVASKPSDLLGATAGASGPDAGNREPMGPALPPIAAAGTSRAVAPARAEVAPSGKPVVVVASNKAPSKPPAAKAKPLAKSSAKASAKSPSGPVYTVQLGAFKARSNAEQFATKLRGKPSRIVRDGSLYRVVSGSFPSKREATVHEASLKRAGFTTYVTTAVF